MGQTLDLLSTQFGQKPKLELFTMDQYNAIVKYKTAYYSFVMPVSLAMYFVSMPIVILSIGAEFFIMNFHTYFSSQATICISVQFY